MCFDQPPSLPPNFTVVPPPDLPPNFVFFKKQTPKFSNVLVMYSVATFMYYVKSFFPVGNQILGSDPFSSFVECGSGL